MADELLEYTDSCPACGGAGKAGQNYLGQTIDCDRCSGTGRTLNAKGRGIAQLLNSKIFRTAQHGLACHPGRY